MKPTHIRVITTSLPAVQASGLPEIAVLVERRSLARRIWRTFAEDGMDLGFDLKEPLRDGDLVLVTEEARYVMRQRPEPVLEIPLDVAPSLAAVIGWTIGNMHCAIEAQADRLVAADEGGLHLVLERGKIPFRRNRTIFQPGTRASSFHSHLPQTPVVQALSDEEAVESVSVLDERR